MAADPLFVLNNQSYSYNELIRKGWLAQRLAFPTLSLAAFKACGHPALRETVAGRFSRRHGTPASCSTYRVTEGCLWEIKREGERRDGHIWFQRYLRSPPQIKKKGERKQQSSFTHAGNWKTSCYHNMDCPLRSLYLLVQKAYKKCLPVLFFSFSSCLGDSDLQVYCIVYFLFSIYFFPPCGARMSLRSISANNLRSRAMRGIRQLPPTSITHYSTPCPPPLVPGSDVTTLPLPLELNTTRVQPRV